MIFHPWKFRALFLIGVGGMGSESLFMSLIAASKYFCNSFIALSL